MKHLFSIQKKKIIGFFDSGIGGLSILNKCLALKVKALVYFADTKYLPYGNKTPQFLLERSIFITNHFLKQNIDTIVIACHTSSATTLPQLKKLFPQVTYIDMLVPTITIALEKTKSGRIGIMATQASIDSHVHKTLLLDRNLNALVFEQACPDFVPLIETQASIEKLDTAIENYLNPLLKNNIDTVILGCTHYAFLEKIIKKKAPELQLISAANCLTFDANVNHKPQIIIQSSGPVNVGPFIHRDMDEKISYSNTFIDECTD